MLYDSQQENGMQDPSTREPQYRISNKLSFEEMKYSLPSIISVSNL